LRFSEVAQDECCDITTNVDTYTDVRLFVITLLFEAKKKFRTYVLLFAVFDSLFIS